MVDSFGLYFITVGGNAAAVAGAVKTVKTSRARDYYYVYNICPSPTQTPEFAGSQSFT